MKYHIFILLSAKIYVMAQQLSKARKMSFSDFDYTFKIGNLSYRYIPMSSEDINLSTNISSWIEGHRGMLLRGNKILPALDPFEIKNLPPIVVDDRVSTSISGNINIKSLKITGAKNMALKSLEVRTKTSRVDFTVDVPLLRVIAKIETHLIYKFSVFILSKLIPVNLFSILRARIKSLKIKIAAQFLKTPKNQSNIYNLSALDLNVHADEMNVTLLNKGIDDVMMVRVLDSIKSKYKQNVDTISNQVANEVIRHLNEILSKFTIDEMKTYILNLFKK